ncbi:MAG: RNA polymerase sigma factor [Flammeovirgaceae bacterium]
MTEQNLEQAFSTFFDEKFDKIFFSLYKRYLKNESSSHEEVEAHGELRIVTSEQTLDTEQIRDFVEEAFTRFYYKKLHTGEIEAAKWESYVYRIANNLIMDFFRKEKKTRKSVNSPEKARPSDKNLLLSVAEILEMQHIKQFLELKSDEELEQSGQLALTFLSNLVTYSIGFIPNQKHIASLLLQDENYEHISFKEAKERLNTRSVSEWYTRGKQAVMNHITQALSEKVEDWVIESRNAGNIAEWKFLKNLLKQEGLEVAKLEVQYKQLFGKDLEERFAIQVSSFTPPLYELFILFNEKKYAHRKLFFQAYKNELDVSDKKLKHILNKQLKLPIDLVRRFFSRHLALINSALQVFVIADCLKQKEFIGKGNEINQ